MRRRLCLPALGGLTLLTGLFALSPLAPTAASDGSGDETGERLYLVTMTEPGTSTYADSGAVSDHRTTLLRDQDDTLAAVGESAPVYRWTTALSGFAAELDSTQAATVAALPGVEMVEPEEKLQLSGAQDSARNAAKSQPGGPGGRGTVIGLVDSGIHTDTPVFAATPDLGPSPRHFRGGCEPAENWSTDECNDKVVGARFFVKGFGAGQLRAGASVSPRDEDGHGTQVASIAAGNADVTALTRGVERGEFSGTAPNARISAYKACWSAPDPRHDGCSSADVVAAIDAAVRDRVDVLNLSMSGRPGLDTVDLALLGAAEQDIVVTMAAGNAHDATSAGQPWTTVVGAATGPDRRGQLRLSDGSTFEGKMAARGLAEEARLVRGDQIPAPGHRRSAARLCVPGSLDAARAEGKIVLCERGRVARVDKSAAVDLADGVGMVLVNAARKALSADFHAVPSLHVSAEEGRRLRRELRSSEGLTGRLVRIADDTDHPRVLPWSSRGRPDTDVVEPAVVAPGFGVLAASPPGGAGDSWDLLSGTSAATATVSGLAARLRSRHPDWTAARIRSAMMTSATSAGAISSLAQGAGVPAADRSARPGLSFDLDAADYRSAVEREDVESLNMPSVMARQRSGEQVIRRTVTNVGPRHMYYSSSARGFAGHRVSVTPAALRIAPGESREFTIRIAPETGNRPEVDSGWVAWRGANGVRVRIPVVLTK